MKTCYRTFAVLALGCILGAGPVQAQSTAELERLQGFLQLINSYLTLIEKTHAVSKDPEQAAILQMQKIQEVYEERGEKAKSIAVLEDVLDNSRNQTIRNGAYFLLGDTLKETGRHDAAIELLRQGLAENIEAAK